MSGILLASVGNSYGSAPVNTVAPAVTGTATVGQTLSTTNGTWTGAPAPTFTYQWQRTGVNIGGATSNTYVLVAADYANTIRCVVKATNSVAPSGVTANSNSTASVAGNAPVNTVAPAVTGTATVGQTLSTTNGTWTGVPTPTFTYQWQRVTTNISGATSSTYVLVNADAANTIRCVVTATNAVSAVSANSNSTASVAATVPGAPTIGTATQTGSTTATVAYTAPASDGGATITSYTATSTPDSITGTLSQAGSGTITVTGLTGNTAYTFTVTATNSAGTSAASAASNSITTLPTIGQAFGGGFFAGQISTSANSVATHNLVICGASVGQTALKWKTSASGGDPTSNIDGPGNSAAMNSATYPAAQFCEAINTGGFTDWYLPAKNELEVLYFNLKPNSTTNNVDSGINPNSVPARASNYTSSIPAQTAATSFVAPNAEAFVPSPGNHMYWSSTQASYLATYGSCAYMNIAVAGQAGKQRGYNKSYVRLVRAVRRVAV